MGRFEYLVDSPSQIEKFRAAYRIPQEVGLRYCSTGGLLLAREVGEVIIPIIAFLEGGMTIPMGEVTRSYLTAHRLSPEQCAPNTFRILGAIDDLNRHLGLGLTWHDVAHMYECRTKERAGYYLRSRSDVVRLLSGLPKSNKGMMDDYLIVSGAWHDGIHCPTKPGTPGGTFPLEPVQLLYLYLFGLPFIMLQTS